MKQNTRVVLAGAMVLGLAAGGGTFALWQNSTQVDGGGIVTGQLDVQKLTDAVYDDLNTEAANDWNNVTDKMVPSDSVGAVQTFKLVLEGKNLKAKLNLTAGTAAPVVADLATGITGTITKAAPGSLPQAVTADMQLDPSYNGATVKVTTTFDFDVEATGSMNSGVTVTGGGVSLTQYVTP